ncbi:hypothetical protein [Microbispora sp. NBRC 16548]|uniref:hypothetical protein n=1 Tax=Microbispora sp. NBRC 16548 TaxID=3030994 RepID=UPI0024A1AF0C|nr:hypothetical protein [Microbispora sp. NBRC 16548]GLX09226.1 hypothetical protein Misp03_61520 [Microbispora sp. NBRC 16548]
MKCQRYGGTAMRKIGLGLLACASVVAALAAAGPAAGATRTHGRETPRHQESGLRPARPERDAAQPGLTATSPTTNRGTQQITINVANGGTGIQNAMCRGNRACDIAQALGTPYAGASPAPAPQASPKARAAARAGAANRGGAGTRAGAAPRAGAASRHAAVSAGRRGTGLQAARIRGRAVSGDEGERARR